MGPAVVMLVGAATMVYGAGSQPLILTGFCLVAFGLVALAIPPSIGDRRSSRRRVRRFMRRANIGRRRWTRRR